MIRYSKFALLLFLLLLNTTLISAKEVVNSKNWFISPGIGIQMSGIKREDFIQSNYSPLYEISVGKWFTSLLSLEFGYRGTYFYLISDNIKHYYNYYYGNVIFNLNSLVINEEKDYKYAILLKLGSGYFYNKSYNQPNICASLGISNEFIITDKLSIILNVNAILGWDIYQGNEDILPGISIGIVNGL